MSRPSRINKPFVFSLVVTERKAFEVRENNQQLKSWQLTATIPKVNRQKKRRRNQGEETRRERQEERKRKRETEETEEKEKVWREKNCLLIGSYVFY